MNFLKKTLAVSILTGSLTSLSFAIPLIDVKAGIGYQILSPSGYVNYDGNNIDVEKVLNWDNSKSIYGFVELGIPILPNIRIGYLPTSYEGTGTINNSISLEFGDITLNDRVYSKFDVNQIDIIAYYGLPIPIIKPKLGLAVKVLDSNIYVKSSTTQLEENADITLPVPLVYAGFSLEMPVIPVGLDVDGLAITNGKSYLLDIKGLLKYNFIGIPLIGKAYIGGGYRYQRFRLKDIDIDGKNLNTDLKFGNFLVETGIQF